MHGVELTLRFYLLRHIFLLYYYLIFFVYNMHSAMEGSLGSTQHDVKLQFKTKTEHLLDIPTPFDIVHWEPAIEVMFLYKGVGTNEFNVSCETDYDLCPRPPQKK